MKEKGEHVCLTHLFLMTGKNSCLPFQLFFHKFNFLSPCSGFTPQVFEGVRSFFLYSGQRLFLLY